MVILPWEAPLSGAEVPPALPRGLRGAASRAVASRARHPRPHRAGSATAPRSEHRGTQARQKGDLQKEPPGGIDTESDDHGLGRSRGGLTTKIHLATDQGQKPMSLIITAGHWHDSPQFQPVLEKIRVPRTSQGRPRTRPDKVRADTAYGSRANRSYLRRRRIGCAIPEKAAQVRNRKKRGSHGGRPPKFDKNDYKQRHAWSAASTG